MNFHVFVMVLQNIFIVVSLTNVFFVIYLIENIEIIYKMVLLLTQT